jgi:predicted tellurium resistance membrane protein TerC
MDWILNPDIWLSLLTLTALEIVLGIDNLVFIAVLVGKLPKEQRQSAQRLGIIMALIPRLVLILAISWIIGLTQPLFTLFGTGFSGKDLVLFAGGCSRSTRRPMNPRQPEGDEGHSSPR